MTQTESIKEAVEDLRRQADAARTRHAVELRELFERLTALQERCPHRHTRRLEGERLPGKAGGLPPLFFGHGAEVCDDCGAASKTGLVKGGGA